MPMSPSVVVLDLDGTCIYTDTFHELLALALKQKPWLIVNVLWWMLVYGRAYSKEKLTQAIDLDPEHLPYNEDFLREAYKLAKKGHYLVLATGTHRILAEKIASYLGIFKEVIATENGVNMTGTNKAHHLVHRFGHHGFVYAGDSRKDARVWTHASDVWVVNPKLFATSLARSVAHSPSRIRVYPRMLSKSRGMLQALNPQAWARNLLILLPVLFLGIPLQLELFSAYVALCLISSGSSILRDLWKIETHRCESPTRPFASGQIGAVTGLILGPFFLIAGLLLSTYIGTLLVIFMALWSFLLIKDDSLFSPVSRTLMPLIVGYMLG